MRLMLVMLVMLVDAGDVVWLMPGLELDALPLQ